jgi:hypothetical protein
MHDIPVESLAELIRPSGYFNQKAKKLKAFLEFLARDYKGSLAGMFREETPGLREKLLGVKGIGPETADSILLYAGTIGCRCGFIHLPHRHAARLVTGRNPLRRIAAVFSQERIPTSRGALQTIFTPSSSLWARPIAAKRRRARNAPCAAFWLLLNNLPAFPGWPFLIDNSKCNRGESGRDIVYFQPSATRSPNRVSKSAPI